MVVGEHNFMKVLVTGAAGFIGYHVTKTLLKKNITVVGIDNLNKYYDSKLKKARLSDLKKLKKKFTFYKTDLENYLRLSKIFKKYKFDYVINLAAQAGVRYSINNPDTYFKSNVLGFFNLLNCSINYNIKHLIAASSSSVYGESNKIMDEKLNTDNPIQFYASTKKSNEVMAHAFSSIYKLPITMLRLFTVYGPWGRPDMSLFKFTNAILKKKKIYLYNKGNHYRDYSYIDDIVRGIINTIKIKPKNKLIPYDIFNLGNGKSINLKVFLKELQSQLKQTTKVKFLKKQQGDTFKTHSNIKKAKKILKFKPKVNYKKGISSFIKWYKDFYK